MYCIAIESVVGYNNNNYTDVVQMEWSDRRDRLVVILIEFRDVHIYIIIPSALKCKQIINSKYVL